MNSEICENKNIYIADNQLTSKLYTIINETIKYKQLKIGVNNIIKFIPRNKIDLIILSADCEPLELLENIANLCEEYDIPYIYIPSKACLGRACGIQRPSLCCAILKKDNENLNKQIEDIKNKIYLFNLNINN